MTTTRINTEILREVVADETNFSRIPHGNKVNFWTGVAARVNKVVKKNKWDEEGEDLTEKELLKQGFIDSTNNARWRKMKKQQLAGRKYPRKKTGRH